MTPDRVVTPSLGYSSAPEQAYGGRASFMYCHSAPFIVIERQSCIPYCGSYFVRIGRPISNGESSRFMCEHSDFKTSRMWFYM